MHINNVEQGFFGFSYEKSVRTFLKTEEEFFGKSVVLKTVAVEFNFGTFLWTYTFYKTDYSGGFSVSPKRACKRNVGGLMQLITQSQKVFFH